MTELGDCRDCPRLVAHLASTASAYPRYHNAPVGAFGARSARGLVVGLAPGLHGANRTGRAFTGDASGTLLFRCLHQSGLASRAEAVGRRDGQKLTRIRITNAVKCLPPGNAPKPAELNRCRRWLVPELEALGRHPVIMALGRHAHDSVLRALDARPSRFVFAHGARHEVGRFVLLDSYHCSRLNVNTGRLTEAMLQAVTDAFAAGVGVGGEGAG